MLSNALRVAGDNAINWRNAFLHLECFTAEMSAGTTRCVFLLQCLETCFLGVLEFKTKAPSLYCIVLHSQPSSTLVTNIAILWALKQANTSKLY